MPIYKDKIKLARLALLVIGIILVVIGFNNCAQVADKSAQQPNLGRVEIAQKAAPIKSAVFVAPSSIGSRLPASVAPGPTANHSNSASCADSTLYSCVQQEFSVNNANASTDGSFACVTMSDGSSICPSGTIRSFNTENYEHSEYICQLKLPGTNGANSTSVAELSAALQQVYDRCLKLVNN